MLTEGQTLCDTVVVNEETYSVSPQIKRVASCIGSYLTMLLYCRGNSCCVGICRIRNDFALVSFNSTFCSSSSEIH